MYRAVIAAIAAGLVLGGCANTPISAPSDYAWSFSDEPGDGAKLAFGKPQSDEVVLMMVCGGHQQVDLSAAGLASDRLTLTSGAASTALRGAVDQGLDGEGGLVETSLPSRDAALRGFQQSGALQLTSGGRVLDLAADDAGRPAVRAFFTACQA